MASNESSSIEKKLKRVKLNNSKNLHQFSSSIDISSSEPPPSSIPTISSIKPQKSVKFQDFSNILNHSAPVDNQQTMDNTNNYTSSIEGSNNSFTSNDNQATCSNNSFQDMNTDSGNTSSSSSAPKSKSSSQLKPSNFFHVLSPMGTILCCSLSCFELTGYRSSELIGQQITKFIYYADLELFKQKFFYKSDNSEFSICYRFEKKQNGYILFEARRISYLIEDNKILEGKQSNDKKSNVHISQNYQSFAKEQCFFIMALPYFSEMDLTRILIDKLKQERKSLHKKLEYYDKLDKKLGYSPPKVTSSVSSSDTLYNSTNSSSDTSANQSQSEDSKLDVKSIKKNQVKKEHLPCTQCGKTEAPEWRKGPMGPKTLCNACGIRFFRDQSKQNSVSKTLKSEELSQPMRFISIQPKPQT